MTFQPDGRYHARGPACHRCDDTGIVTWDQQHPQGGYVPVAYRCTCPLGLQYPKLQPEPLRAVKER